MDFYKEQKFYQDAKDVYVAPCSTHPMFKDRFRNVESIYLVNVCINRLDVAVTVKRNVLR